MHNIDKPVRSMTIKNIDMFGEQILAITCTIPNNINPTKTNAITIFKSTKNEFTIPLNIILINRTILKYFVFFLIKSLYSI